MSTNHVSQCFVNNFHSESSNVPVPLIALNQTHKAAISPQMSTQCLAENLIQDASVHTHGGAL